METSYPLEKIKVVLFENIHTRAKELLSSAGYSVTLLDRALEGDELIEAAGDAHVVGIRSKTQLEASFFEKCTNLWAVGAFCIGTNQIDLDAAAKAGVTVFNAPFSNTRSVAEKVICEVIGLHRKLFDRSKDMHEGKWRKSAAGSREIRGKTLGIVGYGRIGSQVSVLAESMGMDVWFYDPGEVLPMGNAQQADTLEELLGKSDAVTLHVPQTQGTHHLMTAKEMSQMKPGAFLINNARGTVVDIVHLVEALKSGHLGGAAIDVFPEEPPKNEDVFSTPLAGLGNVIMTPHIGGSTLEAQQNIAAEVSGKLVKLLNNGSTVTAVNVPEVDLPTLHHDHHRILHYHRNVPGVLSKINQAAAEAGVNVAAQFLQSGPEYAYMIMDVDQAGSEDLLGKLRSIEETVRARAIW